MNLILIKEPYTLSFSNNPVAFVLAITPYRSAEMAMDLKVIIRVEVEDETQAFVTANESVYYPIDDGTAPVNIQSILKSYLSQYIPPLTQAIPSLTGQVKRFQISYRLLNNNILVAGSVQTSQIYYVIKGGLSYQAWHPKKYFVQMLAQKLFMRFSLAREKVFTNELKYLTWMYPYADNLLQYIKYTIGLNDGTTVTDTTGGTGGGTIGGGIYGIINNFSFAPGSGLTNGVYNGVNLAGGAGSGAIANITVSGNIVTSFVFANRGQNYVPGDYLIVDPTDIGGSSTGFFVSVTTVNSLPGTGTTDLIVYRENVEWTPSSPITGIDFNNTTGSQEGIKSIRIAGTWHAGQFIKFVHAGLLNLADYEYLTFYIKLGTAITYPLAELQISFWNGATQVTTPVDCRYYGFVRTTTGVYQVVKIPISNLAITDPVFDTFYIQFVFTDADDVTIDNILLSVPRGSNKVVSSLWQTYITPAGFNQSGLGALVPAGTLPVWYSVEVINEANVSITSPEKFYIDHRNFYDTKDLMYVTSLGSIETIRLRGQVDAETEYNRIAAEKVVPPDYFNSTILDGANESTYNAELEIFRGDTGFMDKPALDKHRDLMNAKTIYEIKDNRLFPVSIINKNAKWYSNRQGLYSVPIDWQHNFTNENYTPPGLIPAAGICPAVEKLNVVQSGATKLGIAYSLETGYDKIQIVVLIGTETYTYEFTGNSRQVELSYPNPLSSILDLTVQARTVCNNLIVPPDLGPATTVNITVTPNIPPMANDDYFYINTGYITPVQMPASVLANDFDGNGDPVTAIAASGATNAGGTYSIDAAGIVMYTPPSSTYYGYDSFGYDVTDGVLTATAYVHIGIGVLSGTTNNIYVRLVQRNVVSNNVGGPVYQVTCEFWLEFYSDSAGTAPVDVTGQGLVITLHKDVLDITNGNSASNVTFTGTSYEMRIFSGQFLVIVQFTNKTYYKVTYTVVPGAGYVAI